MIYKDLKNEYSEELSLFNQKYNRLGAVRLALALLTIYATYSWLNTELNLYLALAIFSFLGFVFVVKKHREISWNRKVYKALIAINDQEIDYLEKGIKPLNDGKEYINPEHSFSFDLDIFGSESLYHHINRTQTFVGGKVLAAQFEENLSISEILDKQNSIEELRHKVKFRQKIAALGFVLEDKKDNYDQLIYWSTQKPVLISPVSIGGSYMLGFVFITLFFLGLLGIVSTKFIVLSFFVNLMYTGLFVERIKKQVLDSNATATILKQYGIILKEIETENFQSDFLLKMQSQINEDKAGERIKELGKLVLKIQGINFGLGAIFMNGTILYHVHALKEILVWKSLYASQLEKWISYIGQIESLNSLANFAYNNPKFVFPELNQSLKFEWNAIGHPLISSDKRVDNSITLTSDNFIILTGSNMSGKSTFLRTIGVNTVLAKMGSVVCAKFASVHPLPIWVSMRQTDSLSSGESYFFAEVKRLQRIITALDKQASLVLLDEILRGTNSDDKQSGTIGVIEKMIRKKAIGGIATHDLEVCSLTDIYPTQLENKNFEVEIINDELVFDYKLRSGVCKNKSATFLMTKMGIID